jgi:hypothetical protein
MPEEKSGGGWNFWGSFMYRKRVWVQALPWFQICARGRYAEGTGGKSWKGLFSGPFPTESRAGIFHFLEIVTGWLVPSTGQKIIVPPGWYLPPLAENGFLQSRKGAENTKEKSRQCFTYFSTGTWKKWAQFVASFPECPSQTTHPSPFTTEAPFTLETETPWTLKF